MIRVVVVLTLLTALLGVAHRADPLREGLNAAYYADPDWSADSTVSTPVERPSTARLLAAWDGSPPDQFSTAWNGAFLALRTGVYTFSTISDDGSWVYVDGKQVLDNGGRHGPIESRGTVSLAAGVHLIFIRYVQEGGGVEFDLRWARGSNALQTMPGWALSTRRVGYWRFVLSAALRLTLAAVEWLWVAALLLAGLRFVSPWAPRTKRWLEREHAWPALAWIIAGSVTLNVIGIWWGLPGGSWPPDELTPIVVLTAASLRFSQGWFATYFPFHFYVLTLAYAPIMLLDWLGRLDMMNPPVYTSLVLTDRLVSIAAAAGTLLAVFACGVRTFGRRAGMFAAAMLAMVTPLLYYAKTSNVDVPSLFWCAVALLFYLRALDTLRLGDIVAFAACGMVSILTKDPAYGLYVLSPVAIAYRIWQVNRAAGVSFPVWRALFDRRLMIAAVTAAAIFVVGTNMVFNWSGFMDHIRFVTGGGSQNYRGFEPTLGGRAALFALTVDLIRVAWGWPLFLISMAGLAVALFSPSLRTPAIRLAVPLVSYDVFLINVILYNYDRFTLPMCLVLALFGGLAIDRGLGAARGRARPWMLAGVAAALAYSVLHAGMLDLVMVRDSRYTIERWLTAHVRSDDRVAWVFPLQYYPRLEQYNSSEITSVEELQHYRPAWFVLNGEYARSEPPQTKIGRLIKGLQSGDLDYRLAFRFREPRPWPWLPGAHRDLVGARTEQVITSSLRHLNPTYEVFERGGAP